MAKANMGRKSAATSFDAAPHKDLSAADDDGSHLGSIDYPDGFYAEQAPVHIAFACALAGVRPPDVSAPYRYCELGCGRGETLCVLAAANSESQFVGIDLSASHIKHAASVASRANLANVRFIEADITDYVSPDAAGFDFITLHGLYSWVPPAVQGAVRRFLAAELKPRGVAYMTYNALPGWSVAGPLRQFFVTQRDRLEGPLVERARVILDLLEEMRESGAALFRENPMASAVLQRLRSADIRYVAHEFLAADWQPLYFAQVAQGMRASGLEYVGNADLARCWPRRTLPEAQVQIAARAGDAWAEEGMLDFLQNRFFRRDIYARAPTTRHDPEQLVADTLFGNTAAAFQVPDRIRLPDGPSLEFTPQWMDDVRQLLAVSVMSLAQAHAALEPARPRAETFEDLGCLAIGGLFAPFARREIRPPRTAFESIRLVPELNALRLEEVPWASAPLALASTVTGSGILVGGLERALLLALARGESMAWLAARMSENGLAIRPSGADEAIEDPAAQVEALDEAMAQFMRYRLPKLASLGVLEGVP